MSLLLNPISFQDWTQPEEEPRFYFQLYADRDLFVFDLRWKPGDAQLPMEISTSRLSQVIVALAVVIGCGLLAAASGLLMVMSLWNTFDFTEFLIFLALFGISIVGTIYGAKHVRIKEAVRITTSDVEYRSGIGSQEDPTWREPLSNYRGICCYSWNHGRGIVTPWEIVLLHASVEKSIPLYRGYKHDQVDEKIRCFGSLFGLSLISVDQKEGAQSLAARTLENVASNLNGASLKRVFTPTRKIIAVVISVVLATIIVFYGVRSSRRKQDELALREAEAEISRYQIVAQRFESGPERYRSMEQRARQELENAKLRKRALETKLGR
jgi:hypothetical protein